MTRFRIPALFACCSVLLAATACDLTQNYTKMDRDINASVQDYRDMMAAREPLVDMDFEEEEGVPDLKPYVSADMDTVRPMPLVTVSVNETVPLRVLLFDLADQAGFELEMDPQIRGTIIFTARNRPFDKVIERIADVAMLRYKLEDDILRIERDTPYSVTYKIDYLNLVRTNKGTVNTDISVVTGEGAETGSSFEISSEGENDFWVELETNLKQILTAASGGGDLQGQDQLSDSEAGLEPIDEAALNDLGTAAGRMRLRMAQASIASQGNSGGAMLDVGSLPLDGFDSGDSGAGGYDSGMSGDLPLDDFGLDEPRNNPAETNEVRYTPSFAMNKQAGLVSVYASQRLHKEVEEYLAMVRRSTTSQVLVEAKVLEVTLSDEFAAGVDWEHLNALSNEATINFDTGDVRPSFELDTTPENFILGFTGNHISAFVRMLSRFGTVRALASPRLTVLNNQPAMLNVAENEVFFELDVDVTTDEQISNVEVDSEIRNIPEGILINVMPSINLDEQKISMRVRPTITRIVDRRDDPSVTFAIAQARENGGGDDFSNVTSQIPVVNVQEMDSVVRMNSGEVIVMGGLMQNRADSEQKGIPVASEIPIFGSAFRTQSDIISKTELVIFIKATIIEGADSIHDTDREIYRMFSGDRRPFKM